MGMSDGKEKPFRVRLYHVYDSVSVCIGLYYVSYWIDEWTPERVSFLHNNGGTMSLLFRFSNTENIDSGYDISQTLQNLGFLHEAHFLSKNIHVLVTKIQASIS